MKTFISLISGFLFFALTCTTFADDRNAIESSRDTYLLIMPSFVSPFTVKTTSPGMSPGETDSEPGIGISGGIGYHYNNLRFEGEISFTRNNADKVTFTGGGGDLSGYYETWGATVNVYYDFPLNTILKPYAGAGLGGTRFSAKDITLSGFPPTNGKSNVFTYRLMTGFSVALKDSWRFVMGYAFTGMGSQDYETGGVPLHGDSIETHSVQAGLHYYF